MIDAETILAEKLVDTTIVLTTFIWHHLSDDREPAQPRRRRRRHPRRQPHPHGEAWGALTRTHAAVTGACRKRSPQGDFPPLPWYEVLATIADAPEQRMRMGDLAEALVITRGGLTKLVDRLIKAGLLERTFCETDRRVSYATLLPVGRELLEEMRPVVAGELASRLLRQPQRRRGRQLRETLDRVRGTACAGVH